MADRLEKMIETQRLLQLRLGYDFTSMTLEERVEYVRDMYVAAVQELGEALNETSWKRWAGGTWLNADALHGELVDTWHFLINLLLVTSPGLTADGVATELTDGYFRKNAVNHRRQDENYDAVSGKCPNCRRDLAEIVPIEMITEPDLKYRTYCPCGQLLGTSATPA